jgi:hypothetical protein
VRTGRINLKKVRGEENPADIFTKHSLSRDKLQQLVKLFGCHYRDGRAAAAPLLRKSQTSGVKISEADDGLGEIMEVTDANMWAEGVLDPNHDESSSAPYMPHLRLNQQQIDELHPSLQVFPEPDVDDTQADAWDHIYQRGLREAQDIHQSMQSLGRMKYMRNRPLAVTTTTTTQPTTTTTQQPTTALLDWKSGK